MSHDLSSPITRPLRAPTVLAAALAWVCMAFVGCDNDGGGDVAPVTVTGGVGNFAPGQGFDPLEGVTVCILDHMDVPCVVSGADGLYTLSGVPANSELVISFNKADFVPQVGLLTTGESDIGPVEIRLALESAAELFFQSVGGSYPLNGTGGITFGAYPEDTGGGVGPTDGIAGWSIGMEPTSGVGPVFVNNMELPDASLQETQLPGWGLFANVTPGTVRVSFTKTDERCALVRPGYGWASTLTDDTHIDVPVFADMLTAVGLLCTR